MKRKIILSLLMVMIVIFTTSCELYVNYDQKAEDICKKVLKCLDEDDAAGLKSMFCQYSIETNGLEYEIKKGMEFYKGKTTNIDKIKFPNSSGKGVENGKTTEVTFSVSIDDIVTDSDNKYEVVVIEGYQVCTADEKKVGISRIYIESEDGKEFTIGEYVD
ncbi:DUF5104 domain-containing protein [[Clostridium] fimetarium]|nr:DUF5104 domain-containing protein [[Clostridium] fimetarium]